MQLKSLTTRSDDHDARNANGYPADSQPAQSLTQHQERQQAPLHCLGLGKGRARDIVAIAKGHQQQVGTDDLGKTGSGAKGDEGQMKFGKVASRPPQIQPQQGHSHRQAIEIAHETRRIHGKLRPHPLLHCGAPRLEQGSKEGRGEPDHRVAKKTMVAIAITPVAIQPVIVARVPRRRLCIAFRLRAISIITAISGAASTPLTTAAQ